MREIRAIAVPVSLEMVIQLLLTFVNQVIVASLGAVAVAAVGLTGSLTFMFFVTLGALGSGTSILVARRAGAGDTAGVNHTVTVALGTGAELPPVGRSVSVSTAADTDAEAGLAVPLTAVRGSGADSHVIVQDGASTGKDAGGDAGTQPEERRVPVTVGVTGGGYAAVTGELQAGDKVKVS